MKANGGHQIVSEALRTKAQYCEEESEPSRMPWIIGIARVRAAYMCAKRAAAACRILIERELILANLIRLRSGPGYSFLLNRHQRIARSRAADKRRCKFVDLRNISINLPADELPEAPYILPQMTHHEIRSISAKIL